MSILFAFSVTITLLWILNPLAVNLDFVDHPGRRKNHKGSVPIIGGISMFGGLVFSILILDFPLSPYRSFIAGCAILLIIGIMDDQYDLKPISKFASQILVAFLMISWGGMVVSHFGTIFGTVDIHLANWAIPFTVFITVGAINAHNMVDGLDGLAGGMSLFVHGAFLITAVWRGRVNDAVLLAIIVATLFAFLLFNYRIPGRKRALVFMGDGGAFFLGFSIVWFSISLSQGQEAVIHPVTCLWFYALPLMDTVSLIFRRISKRKSPFSSDRAHLHHILIRAGFSVNQSVNFILFLILITCAVGILGEYYRIDERIMFFGLVGLLGVYSIGMLNSRRFIKLSRRRKRRKLNKKKSKADDSTSLRN